jgi:hypothetical protein
MMGGCGGTMSHNERRREYIKEKSETANNYEENSSTCKVCVFLSQFDY